MNNYLGAIEIGGTKIQIVLADNEGKILYHFRFHVRRALGAEGIWEQVWTILREWRRSHIPIAGIGIGFGGPVDTSSGRIICSHQIQGWEKIDLKKRILSQFGETLICIENDANTAALGEAVRGAGCGYENVFYVTLGSGVGGGAVQNGEIYHGALPGEAEIGHLRLDKGGRTVESSCSGWAVDRKIQEFIKKYPQSRLAKLAAEVASEYAVLLKPAIEEGDADACRILDETVDDISFALSHVTHLFHPQVVVLGGGLSLMGELLSSRVRIRLPKYLMDSFHPGPTILMGKLGEFVVPIGALELIKRKLAESGEVR